MKYLLTILLLLGTSVSAQETSPNLIDNNWNNVVVGSHPNNCCTGGSKPLYDPSTNTIHFSYGLTAVHQVHAINKALSGSGVQINGWNWGYTLRNMDGVAGNQNKTTDILSATSFITNSAGQIVQQSDQHYNTQFDWTRFSGTETLNSPITLADNVSLGIQFVAKDNGFWGGYYGPQVKDVDLSANYGVDACAANPLSDPSCPNYAAAYFTQQCSINALFDPSCPGYTTAQCSINVLYSSACPGYQAAYYSQQCSINPLYDVGCPGYATAYLDYQCSIDPLYTTTCSGYAQAYFDQQCTLDGLYDRSCSNYSTAYATKMLLEQSNTSSETIAAASTQPSTEPTLTISSDGTVSTTVSSTGDSNVDKVIEAPKTTAAAPSPAAPVQLTQAPASTQTVASAKEESQEASNDTKSSTETDSGSSTTAQTSETSQSKDQPKTARQELQAKRVAAAKTKAVEEGKQLANKMGDAANMEQQVAVQGVVIAAMGFTKGFDAYGTVALIDAGGYQPYTVYNNQKNVDNRFLGGRLFGGSDRLHADMVDAQYVRN